MPALMAMHDRRTKAAARAARNRRYLCRKKNRVTCANVEVSELVIDFLERARAPQCAVLAAIELELGVRTQSTDACSRAGLQRKAERP